MMAGKNPKAPKGKDNFTRNLVIIMVVGIALIMVIPTVISKQSSGTAVVPSSVSAADGNAISFNTSATNLPVIDIWEDFQCPVCQRFEAVNGEYLIKLIEEKKAKVNFHILSFLGQESVVAANASACAADEGQFLAFRKLLYANQPSVENSREWTTSYMKSMGVGAKITSTKFSECVANGSYGDWVQSVANDSAKKNINSTPTVFVNGKELDRNTQYFDPAAFKKAVEG